MDEPPITDRAATIEQDCKLREVAPFMSYGSSPGTPAEHLRILAGAADQHPHTVSAPGVAPILVVSTTHDPATPSRPVSTLAKQLGGALLTFDGTQHTVVFQGWSASTSTRRPT